jgi:hypothetical protein
MSARLRCDLLGSVCTVLSQLFRALRNVQTRLMILCCTTAWVGSGAPPCAELCLVLCCNAQTPLTTPCCTTAWVGAAALTVLCYV